MHRLEKVLGLHWLFECAVSPAPLSFLGADPVCTLFCLRFVFVMHFNISCVSPGCKFFKCTNRTEILFRLKHYNT